MASALLNNGYPKRFILESATTCPVQCDTVIEDPNATVCLPYVHGISEPPNRVLKGLHIRTVMRPHQTLKQRLEYVHPKDVIPDMGNHSSLSE